LRTLVSEVDNRHHNLDNFEVQPAEMKVVAGWSCNLCQIEAPEWPDLKMTMSPANAI